MASSGRHAGVRAGKAVSPTREGVPGVRFIRGADCGATARSAAPAGSLVGIGMVMVVVASCSSGGSTSIGSVTAAFATPSRSLRRSSRRSSPCQSRLSSPRLLRRRPSQRRKLIAACDKGTPIPEADTYTSTVHPLVVLYYEPAGPTVAGFSPRTPPITATTSNTKWKLDGWPGPIQLVVCAGAEKPVKIGGCPYTYKRTDGKVGTIIRYKQPSPSRCSSRAPARLSNPGHSPEARRDAPTASPLRTCATTAVASDRRGTRRLDHQRLRHDGFHPEGKVASILLITWSPARAAERRRLIRRSRPEARRRGGESRATPAVL